MESGQRFGHQSTNDQAQRRMEAASRQPSSGTRVSSEPLSGPHLETLLQELATAKQDLDFANRQFDEVADPAAIDEVIFRIAAAERKFDRLYHAAKAHNVTDDDLRRLWPGNEVFGSGVSL